MRDKSIGEGISDLAWVGFWVFIVWICYVDHAAESHQPAPSPVDTVTQCVDGIVQQGRPGDWVPVKLKGKDVTIKCPFP